MGPKTHGRGEDQGLYFRNFDKTNHSKMVETRRNSVNVNTESRLKFIGDDTWSLVLTPLCSGLARCGVCERLGNRSVTEYTSCSMGKFWKENHIIIQCGLNFMRGNASPKTQHKLKSWTDRVRNEDVLLRVKEQRNILHEIRKRKANWISHILRRNCLLQRVTEGKIQDGI